MLNIFKLLFGCPTAYFEPFLSGQPHQLHVNQRVLTVLTHR